MTGTNDSDGAPVNVERWGDTVTDDAPPTDQLFKVLANTTRRRTLWLLLDDPRTTVSELADTLVGWWATENAVVAPEDRERVATALFHVHLPILEDSGLVRFDSDDGEIRLSALSEPVRDLIRLGYRYEQVTGAP
ncbi:DNA-binding transcriptional regulator, ArsR family [Halopelagius inordinatus]|uniref:DNA-binding transcriptional regulator, ArsR family n=1 Tax=Halopelagius inordinatus TaxID=553467 RepID=A0A1I2P407_9EURY|nr:helix-turn-helix transcriptional regulator [Halopelagius inordinatus]SFG08191.1 DNA-binding transcriptional regulator, ArsR family [Halopelagius inordinatus]